MRRAAALMLHSCTDALWTYSAIVAVFAALMAAPLMAELIDIPEQHGARGAPLPRVPAGRADAIPPRVRPVPPSAGGADAE